jgi:putative aldouronate transport system substrate-binding protein
MGFGDYNQRIPLVLASPSEPLDMMTLFPVAGMPFNSFIQQGQLRELSDLVANYGQGLVQAVGQRNIDAAKMNGGIYGIPTIKDMAGGFGLIITQEYVDKYNIDLNTIKTLEDVGMVMARIKQAEPNFYPLAVSNTADNCSIGIPHDTLGDDLGVLVGQERKVTNIYERPEYRQIAATLRSFYQAGYIPRDAAIKQEGEQDQLRLGTSIAHLTSAKPGVEVEEESASGKKLSIVRINQPYTTTSVIAGVLTCIPNNSKHPEKAMQLMNLLYTDPVLVNLIDYGIEGAHYVKNSDSTIGYPPGITAETNAYGFSMGWQMGNQFLSHVWQGNPLDIWKQMKEFNDTAERSPAMGFTFDNTAVLSESAACMAVVDQYRGIRTGSIDLSQLDEFNAKLKQAGIEKIIVEKQRQLDAWLAAQ